jgi:predicted ABC-type ATPase
LEAGESFALETTLATKIYQSKIRDAQQKGYEVTLFFFWLRNVEMAKERVRRRVEEGGHNIETNVIERRYHKGIENLFSIYLPIIDGAMIFDNSNGKPELLAQKTIDGQLTISNEVKFNALKNYHDHS